MTTIYSQLPRRPCIIVIITINRKYRKWANVISTVISGKKSEYFRFLPSFYSGFFKFFAFCFLNLYWYNGVLVFKIIRVSFRFQVSGAKPYFKHNPNSIIIIIIENFSSVVKKMIMIFHVKII